MLLQQLANGLVLTSTYVLIATGLTLVFGVLLVPNLAHGEFYMIGAFVTYELVRSGWPFVVAVAASALLMGVAGVIVDRIAFRPFPTADHLPMMLAGLAVATIAVNGAIGVWTSDPRALSKPLKGVFRSELLTIGYYEIAMIVTAIALVFGIWLLLMYTRVGFAMRLMASNERGALLVGISPRFVRVVTFAVGSALAGVAGGLLAGSTPITAVMGFNPMLKAFVIIVIGGRGKLHGTIIAAVFLAFSEVLVAGYISSMHRDTVAFLLLACVLIVRPQGLFALARGRD